MKLARFAFAIAILVLFCPTLAKADLDQMCLKQCIGIGQSSSSCLTRCTYNSPTAVAPKSMNTDQYMSSNRVLGTLTPAPQGPALRPHQVPVASADLDYVCLNGCVHEGSPYHMCEARCVKPTCDATAVLCSTARIVSQKAGTASSGIASGSSTPSAVTPR